MTYLSHSTGWGHGELMAMELEELSYWMDEAMRYGRELARAQEKA